MSSKKGVELSVNTMIIIVLALLVLVIVGYLIIKAVGNQTNQTSCQTRGGDCVKNISECKGIPGSFTCSGENSFCCMPIGNG